MKGSAEEESFPIRMKGSAEEESFPIRAVEVVPCEEFYRPTTSTTIVSTVASTSVHPSKLAKRDKRGSVTTTTQTTSIPWKEPRVTAWIESFSEDSCLELRIKPSGKMHQRSIRISAQLLNASDRALAFWICPRSYGENFIYHMPALRQAYGDNVGGTFSGSGSGRYLNLGPGQSYSFGNGESFSVYIAKELFDNEFLSSSTTIFSLRLAFISGGYKRKRLVWSNRLRFKWKGDAAEALDFSPKEAN